MILPLEEYGVYQRCDILNMLKEIHYSFIANSKYIDE